MIVFVFLVFCDVLFGKGVGVIVRIECVLWFG